MSTSFSDDWLLLPQPKETSAGDTFTWSSSISRSRVSTVDGLGFSENVDVEATNSLESLLRTVQQLKLKRIPVDELEQTRFLAAGETFAVSQCKYQGSVIAIKRLRLGEHGNNSDRQPFQQRLQSVLREVLIMCHLPLAHHPNIISLLGYGWTVEEQRPSPFVAVEFAEKGSLREYMKLTQSIRTKLILMGDVGAGLMALHKCGIVHGDLKIDNVVVFASLERPSGSVAKVSDFGHSILVSSAPEKRTQYLGTALYNAPEVAHQRSQPIPADQLHKCDIWAFGLCVWEILTDGQVYFQPSWKSNSLYERPPSYPDSWTLVKSPSASDTHVSLDKDGQSLFGRFDPSNLEHLAVEFVNGLRIPGVGFEKGMLRPLLTLTLQTDPNKRISDLSRLPIIGFWNKAPGGHSLQSKLATYTLSGDIRYSIFSRDNGPYIIWEQQQQLLREFETAAQRAHPEKSDGSAAFQTMLCYVNAFGTSGNLTKAIEFLHKAEKAGHLIARILGPRMLDGFTHESRDPRKTYSESLALGFKTIRTPEKPSSIVVHGGDTALQFDNYEHFREKILSEGLDKDFALLRVASNSSSVHLHPLEFAVQHGDLELVEALIPSPEDLGASNSDGDLLVVQAASRGHGTIVNRLLKAGAPIFRENSSSLLDWLFCLDPSSLDEIQSYLPEWPRSSNIRPALNQTSAEKIVLHPQWPFQTYSSPLATAIASGSTAAVKVLLALKADPLLPVFVTGESDLPMSHIHLAVRYHFPEILQLLWQAAFGERTITGARLYLVQTLGQFPIACALSLMTNAERFAIHGSAYKEALRNTIQLLSEDILLQASPEGKNAVTQAIDLENVDTVELLLEHCPALASRKLVQPENKDIKDIFTYPLHFAAQIGSTRDTEESVRILESILKVDPAAIERQDSSSVKPIHVAAMGTSIRITEFLLNRGASCQDLDGRGQSPLHFCRAASNAKMLLSSGANVDHKDQLGFTAAHVAATRGSEEVLQVLIDAGADLSFGDNGVGTPLHCATQRKSRTMAEMILKAGVDIDAQDTHGRTPLLVAMDTGRSDLISLLFDNGADPFIEDELGSSPFLMALAWKTPEILSKFQSHHFFEQLPWGQKMTALHFAAEKGEPAPLKQYLRKLPRPSETDDCESPRMITAIHRAAAACRVDLLDVLLSAGFKGDTRDAIRNTPLLLACQAGRNKGNSFPYQRIETCQILMTNGADILARHGSGLTPFKVACAHRDYPLMTLLLEHTLGMNDFDVPARRSRVLASIKKPGKEEKFCKEARALIGNEILEPRLLRNAVEKEEWEFVMASIGGHFFGSEDIRSTFFPTECKWGTDSLDMLRFHSALKNRSMVRHLYSNQHGGEKYRTATDFGRRNLDLELRETKDTVTELLWPGQQKIFASLFKSISKGPPGRGSSASESVSLIGPKVTENLRPRKSKALTSENVAEYGLEDVEFWMTANVGKVVILLEVMQQFTEKMAEIKEQGEDSEALQWARAQLEEIRSHLNEIRETLAVLTDHCESECDTTSEAGAARGWDDLFQQGKSGSAKLHDLTKTLNASFGIVDKALDKKR